MKSTLVGAMLLVAANAYAAPDGENQPTPETTPPPAEPAPTPTEPMPPPQTYEQPQVNVEVTHEQPWYDRMGWSITAGGGVDAFSATTMSNLTDVGGGWDVRLGIGTRLPVSFEASYIGSAQSINALGLDTNAVLVGNGAQGVIRLNGTFGNFPLQPFAFGGAAWRHYSISNESFNTSDIADTTDVLEVPVGAGLGYKTGGFTVDVRGEYRPSFFGNLAPSETVRLDSDNDASLNRWGVNAAIGVEF